MIKKPSYIVKERHHLLIERIFTMNNTQNSVDSRLYGTKTSENLKRAFEHESQNHTRAIIYADIARDEGKTDAYQAIKDGADNDMRLAELWLSYLDELGTTDENLDDLSHRKNVLNTDVYPSMAKDADDEGFYELGEKLRLASYAKKSQSDELAGHKDDCDIDGEYSFSPDTQHKCKTCGYVVTGDKPDRCPLCSYPDTFE